MSVTRKPIRKQQMPSVTERAAADAEAARRPQETPKRGRSKAAPQPPKRIVRVPLSTRIDIELEEAMTEHQTNTRTSKQAMVEEGVRLYLRQEGYEA